MVRVAALPWPPATPLWLISPGRTNRRLVPSDSIRCVMVACTPLPMAIRVMTAAIPITTPSSVSPARSFWVAKDDTAVSRTVEKFTASLPESPSSTLAGTR